MEKPCVFPFTHNKKNMTECVRLSNGRHICPTAMPYGNWFNEDKWGICSDHLCNGIIYKQSVINDVSVKLSKSIHWQCILLFIK